MNKNEMPAIKQLFLESWDKLKSSFGNVFLLSLFGTLAGVFAFFIGFVVTAGVGFTNLFKYGIADKANIVEQLPSFLTPQNIGLLALVFLVVTILSGAISLIIRIAIIYSIGNSDDKPSLGQSFGVGFKLFLPMMIMGFLVSLSTFGSFFFFIIPAIIVSLMFRFYSYEMVLGKKKWLTALAGSIQIMSQHFGEVVLRILALGLSIYVCINLPLSIIQMIVKSLSENAPSEATAVMMVLGVIRFILGIFVALYGIVYSITTYLHAKKVTDETKKPNYLWIVIVSILGWGIAIFLSVQAVKFINSDVVQNQLKLSRELTSPSQSSFKEVN